MEPVASLPCDATAANADAVRALACEAQSTPHAPPHHPYATTPALHFNATHLAAEVAVELGALDGVGCVVADELGESLDAHLARRARRLGGDLRATPRGVRRQERGRCRGARCAVLPGAGPAAESSGALNQYFQIERCFLSVCAVDTRRGMPPLLPVNVE